MDNKMIVIGIPKLLDWLAGYEGKVLPDLKEKDTILACFIDFNMVFFEIGSPEDDNATT